MKKAITLIVILAAVLMAGCSVVERFKVAEKQYLETRVAELMEELPAETAVTVEPVATEEVKAVETEVAVEETVEATVEAAVEETIEATEEPEVEETPDVTEEPEVEPTVVSFDPAVYLGSPDWVHEMDVADWDISASEYDLASFANGSMTLKALHDEPGWRIAPTTEELSKAYMEGTFSVGVCSGIDSYGLIVRTSRSSGFNSGYFYAVTCDGRYSLRLWDGAKSVMLVNLTASDLINKGKDQANRLGVAAVGDNLTLFINGVKVNTVVDEKLEKGYFGVFINRDKTKDLTIKVDQVRYWADPEIK
jgi:hypothetical protein